MWTVILLTCVSIATPTKVPYQYGSESELDFTVGVTDGRTHYDEEIANLGDAVTRKINNYPNNKQVTDNSAKPFINQQFHPHGHLGHHRSNNRHVNCNKNEDIHKESPKIIGKNHNVRNGQRSINIKEKGESNTHITNTNTVSNNTKITPVTERPNNTQTNIKTVINNNKTQEIDVKEGKTLVSVKNNTSKTDEDRWIWENGPSTQRMAPNTTQSPTEIGVGDRAAFTGDGCATGQVKVGTNCVDED